MGSEESKELNQSAATDIELLSMGTNGGELFDKNMYEDEVK